MRLSVLAALAVLATPFAAFAQMAPAMPAPACAAMDKDLPAELAGWTDKVPLAAATSVAGLSKAALAPGRAYLATLAPTPEVAYATQPEKPGGTVSKGGLFSLTIDKPGAYVIALGTGAWIDVLKDGAAARSTAHGRGPACTTLRKMVTFDLMPGAYVVQISANAETSLPIMVAAKP
ncbi:homogentisate 1,2-dioxygenase [Caulobacter sp. RL271]|jgi:hypothetical protein|uniref:Homogentisate 1,2-dioxygenase n=1 Tax=Caulobacter segnis TaxID=88688 RepID=A0ABY4ZUL1_9CAUL|nr:homogentisate 1,2-dioxygenase [Caulobacter segnis]USQ96378.1 homogentisate 1,2-dioxygenase [Caulobacter segnis]